MLEINELLCVGMFGAFIALLFSGYPVAWVLGGVSLMTVSLAAFIFPEHLASGFYSVEFADLRAVVSRVWAIMQNWVLVALPMFVFMGLMLDRSGIAHELMNSFVVLLGRAPAGMAITVAVIGLLLAASTGIIGASVVLLALLGLPMMLNAGYSPSFASGTVSAVGTLGILVPPSIMLVLMADRTPGVDAGSLFMGAMFPGLLLAALYVAYLIAVGVLMPQVAPMREGARPIQLSDLSGVCRAILPPSLLILAVLGSIFAGIATPTEAAGVGAFGAMLLAWLNRRLSWKVIREVCDKTTITTAFIFAIFIGATAFAYVFQSLGGEELIHHSLSSLPFSHDGILIAVLLLIFVLGFFLDWIEITLIVLPLVAPVVAGLEVGPADVEARMVWFVILVAVCLQTSFLTPPVGFALFYLKGVAPPSVSLLHVYKGVLPFITLQIAGLVLIYLFPSIATWLPQHAYR